MNAGIGLGDGFRCGKLNNLGSGGLHHPMIEDSFRRAKAGSIAHLGSQPINLAAGALIVDHVGIGFTPVTLTLPGFILSKSG